MVELCLEDGIEMAGHSTVTLGRDSTETSLIHFMVLKSMSVFSIRNYLYNCGIGVMIGLESGLERKKIYIENK